MKELKTEMKQHDCISDFFLKRLISSKIFRRNFPSKRSFTYFVPAFPLFCSREKYLYGLGFLPKVAYNVQLDCVYPGSKLGKEVEMKTLMLI